jgi:hypothetical protein
MDAERSPMVVQGTPNDSIGWLAPAGAGPVLMGRRFVRAIDARCHEPRA